VISVVDDDASVRAATTRLLKIARVYRPRVCVGKRILTVARLRDTSCLIADVQMPGMSGVQLQEYLIAQGHSTPIIFITAFPEDSIREQAMNAGAICFLSKPFDGARLIECVDRALNRG
jgi:FixJ family two-component response regulator